ncbi:hypothetical protein Tco_0024177 [Tanacetum coccineum]
MGPLTKVLRYVFPVCAASKASGSRVSLSHYLSPLVRRLAVLLQQFELLEEWIVFHEVRMCELNEVEKHVELRVCDGAQVGFLSLHHVEQSCGTNRQSIPDVRSLKEVHYLMEISVILCFLQNCHHVVVITKSKFSHDEWKRLSEKRTKNQAKTDKTKHGVEKRGKAKVKSKPKLTKVKVNLYKSQRSKPKPTPKNT